MDIPLIVFPLVDKALGKSDNSSLHIRYKDGSSATKSDEKYWRLPSLKDKSRYSATIHLDEASLEIRVSPFRETYWPLIYEE